MPMSTTIAVKWRRGESAPSDTQPIRDAVVVATAGRATQQWVPRPSFIRTRDTEMRGGRPGPRRSWSGSEAGPRRDA